ncbi:MAG: hypothetical protein HYY25_09775 [Candidatus Wallbacteria bacterium]|nr:hypothetical protein [Candidatus Wallbacteria bacterium]
MRFVVTGEWTRNRLLMTIVWLFLLYTALFWVSNGALYFHSMGLTPSSVVSHYLGDEAKFTQPKTYRGMLEVSHFHLFSMGVLLLTLTHLVLFVPIEPSSKAGLIAAAFLSAVADELAGWLVRFAHPGFAWLKIASFLTLEISLAALMLLVLRAIWSAAPSAYAEGDPRRTAPETPRAEEPR